MKLQNMNTEQEALVANAISDGKAIPMNISAKERKLHMKRLQTLIDELKLLQSKFTPRKGGGMSGVPKSVRNRINILEKVIAYKTNLLQEAINESSRTSEDT